MKRILQFFAILITFTFSFTAQAVESHTVTCTAGNLATVAASYLTTVTNLTVTGTIDARDFKTMRDAMPLLEDIDLSGSTVSAYTGTAGTAGTTSTAYPVNGIPIGAFCLPLSTPGKTSLKSFIYPSLINSIGNYAFYSCTGLTGSLIIPSTVTNIGDYAFSNCSGYTGTLNISSSITTIGANALSGLQCWFNVFYLNPNYSSLDGILFNKAQTKLIQCPISKTGTLTIPSSVTTIGVAAFSGCDKLTGTLNIPSTVTSIEAAAFNRCTGFTGSLIIPSSITLISDAAFNQCSGFKGSLVIPSTVTTIGESAFSWCYGFTGSLIIPSSVTIIRKNAFQRCGFNGIISIPSSVSSIGSYAFDQCLYCTSIYAYGTTPVNLGGSADVFSYINKTNVALHVPKGSITYYSAATLWKDFKNIIEDIVPVPKATFGTSVSSTSFIANWSAVTIATKYFLDVATDNTFTNMVAGYNNLDVSNVTLKSIVGLNPSTTYYYRVRTFCALGTSENSNIISTTTKINQVITFNALADKNYGSAPFIVAASGGASGNPVTFSSSNNAVAKCSGTNGSTITIVGAGICNIKANQLGDYTYGNASEVVQSLTINKAPLSVTANNKTRPYGAENPSFDVTITGFINGQTLATSGISGTVAISCSADATTPIGTIDIIPSLGSLVSNNYSFNFINGFLTIDQATAVESLVAQNSITLYPNPANTTITVSKLTTLVSDKDIILNITDISGNMLLTKSIEPTLNSATIDISNLSSGAYVMVIKSCKGNVVKRFLKR